jgi:hypothetical protein
MEIFFGHSQFIFTKHRGLVHVVPKAVQFISSFELIWLHEVTPPFLGILVQKVYPDRLSRPAVAHVCISILVTYEDVLDIIPLSTYLNVQFAVDFSHLVMILKFFTTRVYKVTLVLLDMRVNYENYPALLLRKFFVKNTHLMQRELTRTKFEISLAICMIYVNPEYIDWKPIL